MGSSGGDGRRRSGGGKRKTEGGEKGRKTVHREVCTGQDPVSMETSQELKEECRVGT